MATPRTKADVGMTLVILFLITLATGIILHLKKHGIVLEPRPVIKIIHWAAGFAMVTFAVWHGIQFRKVLPALRQKFTWFWCDTWIVILLLTLTLISGAIKLLSPVKIPHLGLWHYWFGLIMSISAALHLVRGIPSWNRLRKIKGIDNRR